MIGFQFSETMQGTWRKNGTSDDKPIVFSVTARAASLWNHLFDKRTKLDGTINAEGLATNAAVTGELTLDPLGKRIIRYDLEFVADDKRNYRLRGQKDVRFLDLQHSMTTLPATIYDDRETPIGSSMLTFDKRDLPSFLASWRLA